MLMRPAGYRFAMDRSLVPLLLVVAVAAAAGCSRPPPPTPPIVPTIATPSIASESPVPPAAPVLPANCGAMVPGDQLDVVLGLPVSATVSVIFGEAIPGIGRTGRITCRYGVPAAGTYPLDITLNSYSTPQQAVDRVTVTVTAAEQRGVGSSTVPAGGVDGRYLPFPEGGLVVASAGVYSVAVTMSPTLLPPPLVSARAAAIAGIVLAQAGV